MELNCILYSCFNPKKIVEEILVSMNPFWFLFGKCIFDISQYARVLMHNIVLFATIKMDYYETSRCGNTARQLQSLLDIHNPIEFKDAIQILERPRPNDALYFSCVEVDHCWVMRYEKSEWVVYQSFIDYFLPRKDKLSDQKEMLDVFKNSCNALQKDSDKLWTLLNCQNAFRKCDPTLVQNLTIFSNNSSVCSNETKKNKTIHDNECNKDFMLGFICGTLFVFTTIAFANRFT